MTNRHVVFVARRRFDPSDGDRWSRYLDWSGLSQLRELVSLDTILCPGLPTDLVADDWEHNVQADYQLDCFRSLPYLLRRVAGEDRINILAILRQPSSEEVARQRPEGFAFAGFEVLDVHGDVSALTNCGGFDRVFAGTELNEVGLLRDLTRANEVRRALRDKYAGDPHAECDVWAIWRLADVTAAG